MPGIEEALAYEVPGEVAANPSELVTAQEMVGVEEGLAALRARFPGIPPTYIGNVLSVAFGRSSMHWASDVLLCLGHIFPTKRGKVWGGPDDSQGKEWGLEPTDTPGVYRICGRRRRTA